MYTEINKQMEEAQQGVYQLRKIDSMLKELRNEQQALERKVHELKGMLDKENHDVQKLEKKSLANIFYSAFGNLEQLVEKEQSEALAAKLKYDQAVRELDEVKHEISELASERMKYRDCKDKYDRMYAQKKDMLMKSGMETTQSLLDLTEQLNARKNGLREIKEAISAGGNVIDRLDNALKSLDSAHGWGTWDMLGGGLISDLAKHSHIDDAKHEVEQAQALLRRFKAELADVNINGDIHFDTDGFAKFADFFFDGLIADWVMQSKIENSHENVARARSQVQGILGKLQYSEGHISSAIKKLETEIDNLITKT